MPSPSDAPPGRRPTPRQPYSALLHPDDTGYLLARIFLADALECSNCCARMHRELQLDVGVCFIDQWIPENPLSMRDQGFATDARGATTGAEAIMRDGDDLFGAGPELLLGHRFLASTTCRQKGLRTRLRCSGSFAIVVHGP